MGLIWNGVVAAFKWSFSHVRLTFEILLILSFIILGWRYNRKVDALSKAAAEKDGLAADLRQQIKISNSRIEILTRQKDGSVVYKERYVPPEGYVIVKQKEQAKLQEEYAALLKRLQNAKPEDRSGIEAEIGRVVDGLNNTIEVKDKGFTFKPGFGLGWGGQGFKPRIDAKFAFWGRYGLIAGGGPNGIGVGASRHLDDLIWGRPKNLEFYSQYNPIQVAPTPGYKVEAGLRANLW